ncbi:hypothetical protein ACF0H5_019152 [Mactra antiquata]
MATKEYIGVALFGVGRIGRIHLKNLLANKRINLEWIVDQFPDAAETVLREIGANVKVTSISEIDNVLKDSRVDAVVVCTPTDSHARLSIQALNAGKHVLCEKPLTEVTSEMRDCYDAADQSGKVLMAAFNRKFDASYRDMYSKVKRGDIGDIHMIRSTFRDTPLWYGADTLSQTFLCHDIDIVTWFAGSLPVSVVCFGSANYQEIKDKKDIDCVVVMMKFENGTIGVLDFNRYSCYGYDIRLEVFGSKGMLKMNPLLQTTVQEFTKAGQKDADFCVSFPDRFREAYVSELDHFVDVIQGKTTLSVPREQCIRVGIVLDAIKESYNTGKIVYLQES